MLDSKRARAFEALDLGPVWVSRSRVAASAPARSDDEHLSDRQSSPSDPGSALARETLPIGVDERWKALGARVSACRACPLGSSRQNPVLGGGNTHAPWMLIGEAPGAEEDRLGEPFVGRAGALLDSILQAVGLDRNRDVYISNVLKCRPPGNRNPEPAEVSRCEPHLAEQVSLVAPRLLMLMGRFASQTLLRTDASIASLRGRVHRIELGGRTIQAVVSYHPAYLLRNPADKRLAWADWCLARKALSDAPPQ